MNKTIIIEKKNLFNPENKKQYNEFKNFLNIKSLKSVRILNVYNVVNVTDKEYETLKNKLLVNKNTDIVYEILPKLESDETAFRVQAKDGQYNQREDMTNEYIKKFFGYDNSFVKHSKILILKGVSEEETKLIKNYYINQVDSKELALDDESVYVFEDEEKEVEVINGFLDMTEEELKKLISKFAMDLDDIKFVQDYFKTENRNPT